MANRPSNVERNEWTLSLLDLRPTDHVLEIGYGPGIAIRKVAETVTRGHIVGLDHSGVMLSQASRRNADSLATGRTTLMLGSVSALTELSGPFDRIYSVNVFMFWDDPVGVFQALRRLLAPTGVLATTLQPRGRRPTDEDTVHAGNRITESLKAAGFTQVRLEFKAMKPASVVCAVAHSRA
jgi:ubiquinone/menaquinone biosynthesis C-methylase UbiE